MTTSALKFLNYYKKPNTSKMVWGSLSKFIGNMYDITNKGDGWKDQVEQYSIQYLSEPRDHMADIMQFSDYLSDKSPSTQNMYISFVKLWLAENDITFKHSQQRALKRLLPNNKPSTEDIIITQDMIRQIYTHIRMPGKAMVLIMMSSGLRIGELCHIRMQDINLETSPAEIVIPDRIGKWTPKNGEGRYTFISSEAVDAVKEWLKVRDQYLATSCAKTHFCVKSPDDDRLFPMFETNFMQMLRNALKKAGLHEIDTKTNRSRITAHSFRKFFFSQLKTVMAPEMVELLGGHGGYLSDSYRRYTRDQVRQEYLKGEFAVSMNAPDIELKMDLENQKSAMQALMSENLRTKQEMDELKRRMDKMSNYSATLDELMAKLPVEELAKVFGGSEIQ